jgi:endonuclease/exonuclease/phosphatase family metal-dependent hydrolase
MKIATFNVEFLFDEGKHKHSGTTWMYPKEYVAGRVEHLAKVISDIDADVIFLQEVASENVIKRIVEKIAIGKSNDVNYSYFLAEPDKRGVGNAVIYRLKDCNVESIPAITGFPVMVEGDADMLGPKLYSRRAFVSLTTMYKGKPLHLFGLHLNSRFFVHLQSATGVPLPTETQMQAADGLIRSEVFRSIQARKMRQVIDELFVNDHTAQIAVMGDFNSLERETPFRIIVGEFTTHDDALISPASTMVPSEKRYSFIGDDNGDGKNGKKLIDYILISKPLEVEIKSFQIYNETLSHHNNKPPVPTFIESDHAPVVVELDSKIY